MRHQAKNHIICWSFLIFCEIPQNSADVSKFCGKGQIPQLGLKFHGPRKTVDSNNYHHSIVWWWKVVARKSLTCTLSCCMF